MKLRNTFLFAFMIAMLLAGCNPTTPEVQTQTLTIMTHDSFSVSEDLITRFENENNVSINFIKSGDTGAALNRAILLQLKGTPAADLFYGVDNTFLSRALDNDIFEPYDSPMLAVIPDEFKVDPEKRALPIDYGDVCINYDKAWFTDKGLAVPETLEDLTKPEYAGLLAVENPAVSSPGLSFLLATIVHFGEDSYLGYWQQLMDNGVVVVSDWETAYYTNFSASSGRGPQPMVVSYASSPPAELIFAEQPLEEAPTASIIGVNTCFRQIEFVGILKGTANRAMAEKFIDFMLSKTYQEDLPLQMFVFPVNPEAELPAEFVKAAQIPDAPATLDPIVIGANRDAWIQAWTELVIQ
ncbi:MAG: thiamine ABC transporter substrate-binding protein [Anaerolineaceae bacterium]|nr:thiamine ABC transporter substrate-binding protein [Anaerolineaceae bacterium]